jgi:DNA-binding NtrC family response regulator
MVENKHILLVDDEEEIVVFMSNFLKRFKIASTKATSGEEAVRVYDPKTMEYVFLDLHLKTMDGFAVMKILKDINPDVKIIIIAGSPDKDSIDKAYNLGAIDYITKPLDLSEFKIKIDKYILNESR